MGFKTSAFTLTIVALFSISAQSEETSLSDAFSLDCQFVFGDDGFVNPLRLDWMASKEQPRPNFRALELVALSNLPDLPDASATIDGMLVDFRSASKVILGEGDVDFIHPRYSFDVDFPFNNRFHLGSLAKELAGVLQNLSPVDLVDSLSRVNDQRQASVLSEVHQLHVLSGILSVGFSFLQEYYARAPGLKDPFSGSERLISGGWLARHFEPHGSSQEREMANDLVYIEKWVLLASSVLQSHLLKEKHSKNLLQSTSFREKFAFNRNLMNLRQSIVDAYVRETVNEQYYEISERIHFDFEYLNGGSAIDPEVRQYGEFIRESPEKLTVASILFAQKSDDLELEKYKLKNVLDEFDRSWRGLIGVSGSTSSETGSMGTLKAPVFERDLPLKAKVIELWIAVFNAGSLLLSTPDSILQEGYRDVVKFRMNDLVSLWFKKYQKGIQGSPPTLLVPDGTGIDSVSANYAKAHLQISNYLGVDP